MTEIFDRIPLLSGAPRSVEELPGGLTNHNYKVTVPGGAYVARDRKSTRQNSSHYRESRMPSSA